MSFEASNISARLFHVPRPLPNDFIERFSKNALPSLESLSDGVIHGWVTGRHSLDRNITDDGAMYGGHLRLMLTQVERKVPAELLKAEVQMEMLARMAAEGVEFLKASARREIRRSIEQRLLKDAQPIIKTIPIVYDARAETIWAGAMSGKSVDAFQIQFAQTIGFSLIPASPDMAAMRLKSNVNDWKPVCFTPDSTRELIVRDAGSEFLTWLWFIGETSGAMNGTGVMIEGPLQFEINTDSGARDVVCRKGEPMQAGATKAALLSGGLLVRAKVSLTTGDRIFTFTLDAKEFTFRGLRLPDGEKLDAISRFQQRMDDLDEFRKLFFGLYEVFIRRRTEDECNIQEWVKNRKVRT